MSKITLAVLMLGLTAQTGHAQEAGGNELTAGATYSSLHGAVAVVGLDGKNIADSGVDLSVNFRKGKTGNGGNAQLRYGRDIAWDRLGQDARLYFGAEYVGSNWSDEAYKSETRKLSFGFSAGVSENFAYTSKLFWQKDNLSDLGASASPLVTAAQGSSTAAGLAFEGHFGHVTGGVLPMSGMGLDSGISWAGLGDRKSVSLFAALTAAHPVAENTAVIFRAETGNVKGLQGQDVSILDRAFLGGTGGPRGFAFGSLGPRDYVAGSTDTPLGGTRYSMISGELRRDISEKLSVGLFADAGAVWDLGASPVVGAMGTIDDARMMRASGGVSFYWETGIGKLNLSLAAPIRSQDTDKFNQISLGLLRSF